MNFSLLDIDRAFKNICNNQYCDWCPISQYKKENGYNSQSCSLSFAHAVLTNKLDLKGNPVTRSNEEKDSDIKSDSQIPTWCVNDQWVITKDGIPAKIVCVNETGYLDIDRKCNNLDNEYGVVHFSDVRPIYFRPYTDEDDLKFLLGKKLHYVTHDGMKAIDELIYNVGTMMIPGNNVYINNCDARYLFECHADIDGVPFGMPVISERAKVPM